MCKFTGKSNLTFEEALVSEKCAAEKVQQFPKDLIVPALQIIQYSKNQLARLNKFVRACAFFSSLDDRMFKYLQIGNIDTLPEISLYEFFCV